MPRWSTCAGGAIGGLGLASRLPPQAGHTVVCVTDETQAWHCRQSLSPVSVMF